MCTGVHGQMLLTTRMRVGIASQKCSPATVRKRYGRKPPKNQVDKQHDRGEAKNHASTLCPASCCSCPRRGRECSRPTGGRHPAQPAKIQDNVTFRRVRCVCRCELVSMPLRIFAGICGTCAARFGLSRTKEQKHNLHGSAHTSTHLLKPQPLGCHF